MEYLIKRAKKKDPDAFTELMHQQMQMMYKVGKLILSSDEDIADAIQETILTCWEKLDTLKNILYFKTWLTRILINKCNDQIRKQKNCFPIEQVIELSAPNTDFDNLKWNETLNLLDEKYRLVIILYYIEGYSHESKLYFKKSQTRSHNSRHCSDKSRRGVLANKKKCPYKKC
jgi:RNA polymerase sigma factor (sigma-70 family)